MYGIQNKEIKELYETLCMRHDKYTVFSDFVKMCAISMYNSFANNQAMEEEYLRTINHYQKEEQEIFIKMFAKLIMLYENSKEIVDILGPMYMGIKSKDKHLGQVFTPTNVSDLMAKISISKDNLKKIIEEKGYITMSDPTCGAGRNGIIICKSIKRRKY